MKNILQKTLTVLLLFLLPLLAFGQAPDLGVAGDFVLFSTDGAVSNSGISQLTGKVGTNNGSSTGFGNVNGGMHDGDATSAQAAADLLIAYNQLNVAVVDSSLAPALGGGQTLTPGVYAISAASTLNMQLTLDAQNNTNAVFIFKINGSLSTNANSSIRLINGAQACNVFWKVEGLVEMASGTAMKGTVIANNAGINMNTGDVLEGRALSTSGAITVDGILAYTPIGCGSPVLTGPDAPTMGEVACYGIFSSDGPVENTGISNVNGDVGANVGLTTGFDSLLVSGNIHPIPDGSTADAAADLLLVYNYLNGLSHDIELLYPAQFGRNLVLTPHTYILNGATSFQDTLFLNAQGNANAVFVIKIYGALSTSTFSNVVLRNGTQAKNVYWLVNGAVDISENSVFNGTIVSQGAISLFSGVEINGRALTAVGALSTTAIDAAADISVDCETIVGGPIDTNTTSIQKTIANISVHIYPNPFAHATTISINNIDQIQKVELRIFNVLGKEVLYENITSTSTTIATGNLPSGVYFYELTGNNQLIKSGKLIAQQ